MGQAKRRGTLEQRIEQAEPRRQAAIASAQAHLQAWWDAQTDDVRKRHGMNRRTMWRFLRKAEFIFKVRGLTFPVNTTVGTM
jgi:hypothetical protein